MPHTFEEADEPAAAEFATLMEALDRLSPTLEEAARAADETGLISPATWTALRDAGTLRAALPAAEGGLDLAAPAQGLALSGLLRTLGGIDLPLARLLEGHITAIGLVGMYGSPGQRARLAAAVRDRALSAVWGADAGKPLRAERVPNGVRLRGVKVLASGAGFASRPLVTAATPDGPLLLLLHLPPGEHADVSGWTVQGMRSTATGTVELEGMVLPADAIVGGPGDFLRQPHFSGGAWRFCAAHCGAAERLVDLFRQQLVARGRHDDPYQIERISAAVTAVTTARLWIEAAARRLASNGDADATVAFVNLTRGVTERAALTVLEAVDRGVGLMAFVRPNPIERIARDLRTYLRQPVPDLAMADAARYALASRRPVARLWDEA